MKLISFSKAYRIASNNPNNVHKSSYFIMPIISIRYIAKYPSLVGGLISIQGSSMSSITLEGVDV